MASQVGFFRKRQDILRKKQIAAFLLLENDRNGGFDRGLQEEQIWVRLIRF